MLGFVPEIGSSRGQKGRKVRNGVSAILNSDGD